MPTGVDFLLQEDDSSLFYLETGAPSVILLDTVTFGGAGGQADIDVGIGTGFL